MPEASEINIEIEKLSLGGSGIAKHQGLVIFIPYSVPGDVLKIKIVEKKKNFAKAEIVEIIKAGPSRVQAPCHYYEKCGGCNWQHIEYSEQLRQKDLIAREQLKEFITEKTKLLPIQPSPEPFRYRNRVQIHFDGKNFGFRERKSHKTINIEDCLITEESITSQFAKTKSNLKSAQRVQLSLSQEGQLISSIEENHEDLSGFSQVNRFQNEKLIKQVLEFSKYFSYKTIWDFYAGSGNFTFPLLNQHREAHVIAVELNTDAVAQAQEKIKSLSLSPKKARFYLSDVGAFLKRTLTEKSDLILLDPPRTGCSEEVMNNLSTQIFQKMLYISCNPSTLARDLRILITKNPHLRLSKMQVFDMFPQTDHIEVLAELVIDT